MSSMLVSKNAKWKTFYSVRVEKELKTVTETKICYRIEHNSVTLRTMCSCRKEKLSLAICIDSFPFLLFLFSFSLFFFPVEQQWYDNQPMLASNTEKWRSWRSRILRSRAPPKQVTSGTPLRNSSGNESENNAGARGHKIIWAHLNGNRNKWKPDPEKTEKWLAMVIHHLVISRSPNHIY